jgi:hypothetical protein
MVEGPDGEMAYHTWCELGHYHDELTGVFALCIPEPPEGLKKGWCMLKCMTLGFSDDVVFGGGSLLFKPVRTFLSSPMGKLVTKTAGVCGFAAAGAYCTYECEII